MAKELPYFKFEPNQWENGNIQMLPRASKGLFMDLCSMYWSRLGDVPYKLAVIKLCNGLNEQIDELINEGIITLNDDAIYIEFLEQQLSEFEQTSAINSKNAKEGWEKRRASKGSSGRNAVALKSQCENDAIREEKRREEKSISLANFEKFWELYDYKKSRAKCLTKWKNLSNKQQSEAISAVPAYVNSTKDKQYRKHPITWLNGECWKDELSNELSFTTYPTISSSQGDDDEDLAAQLAEMERQRKEALNYAQNGSR